MAKNRINGTEESRGLDQHEYSQLILDKKAMATQVSRQSVQQMGLEQLDI